MNSLGVVVPCYMGGEITIELIKNILKYADKVVLVDDKCPLRTGEKLIESRIGNKVHVIFNNKNLGVGG